MIQGASLLRADPNHTKEKQDIFAALELTP